LETVLEQETQLQREGRMSSQREMLLGVEVVLTTENDDKERMNDLNNNYLRL
jgi:hypothetical protein